MDNPMSSEAALNLLNNLVSLNCEATIRAGSPVWDAVRIAAAALAEKVAREA